jgi:hypothetical protein
VLDAPTGLAFDLHTQVAERWFAETTAATTRR